MAFEIPGLFCRHHRRLALIFGRELRAVEEADGEGTKFPRFKKSDDATALLFALV